MNKCGTCKACCNIYDIKELDKPTHTLCEHHTGKGCGIYKSRPIACMTYKCGYLANNWREELRPDKCGVIIDFRNGVVEAQRIKDEVDPIILEQIEFIEKTYGVKVKCVDARNKKVA